MWSNSLLFNSKNSKSINTSLQKTFRIDGSLGQITEKLDDKIQDGSGVTVREKSFEELTNFIPTNTSLVSSIDGVKLEYMIKSEPCKVFNEVLAGYPCIIHIFEDRIITKIATLDKIFVDIVPSDIKINIDATSTLLATNQETIIFNSTTGVYFAKIIDNPLNITNGFPFFTGIKIPAGLKGEQIKSVVSNVYCFWNPKQNSTLNTPVGNIPYQVALPDNNSFLNGFYIERRGGLSVGDEITIDKVFYTHSRSIKMGWGKLYREVIGYKFIRDGVFKIYPSPTLPNPLTNPDSVNIPSDAVQVSLFYITPDFSLLRLLINENQDFFLPEQAKYCTRYYSSPTGFPQYKTWFRGGFSTPTFNVQVDITKKMDSASETQIFNPYTPAFLNGRLAVSTGNRFLLSKTGDIENFDFNTPTPTETDAFFRTIQGIQEITFISKWGKIGVDAGFIVGTPAEILFFSTIANVFNLQILQRLAIPCSYIPPVDITFSTLPATIIVERGRRRMSAIIFTRDQQQIINLTQNIDFFDDDYIKKIQSIKYGDDRLLFVLTESNKLYGCITGGTRLAWFKIVLNYSIVDITAVDYELQSNSFKRLVIVSDLENSSSVNLVGSINFDDSNTKIRAEYYFDEIPLDKIFPEDKPSYKTPANYVLPVDIPQDFKDTIIKPLTAKLTLHNQEVINRNYNTKAGRVNRRISNVNINVRDSNYFSVKFICKSDNQRPTVKTAFDVTRNNNNLDPIKVKELIKIFEDSPCEHSVKLSIETLPNSTIPLTIQSISFDTEYVNIK